jgi:hypothetical protein
MDKYDYSLDEPAARPGSKLQLWDMLSILMVLLSVCVGGYFLLIFVNPNSGLNPLPPQPGNPFAPATFTPTALQLEATWTASPTIEPTITETPRPTFTALASPTFFSLIPPTATPKPTSTPEAPFGATVNAIESIIIPHLQASACNWLGVGGTVEDSNNSPIVGMVVRVVGTLNGKSVNLTTVSGVSPDYGKSGFEFQLGTVPVSSNDSLYLQLLDQAGLPLSDNIYIDTFNDCKKNLILVRFKKNR